MAINNKQKLLIGLALVLAAMMTYRLVKPFRQPTVPKLTYSRTNKIVSPQKKGAMPNSPSRPTKIKTALLVQPPRLELKVHRDPFRRPVKTAIVSAPNPPDQKPPPRLATPDERAREKLQRFKAFGSFRQNDRTSLFLQRGKQVLVVNVGDRIDGKFKIEAIDGRIVVVSTSETTETFEYEFEELNPAGTLDAGYASPSAARTTPTRRPAFETPSPNAPETTPPDLSGSSSSESYEDRPPPSLPEPPPVEKPALPFRSKESPSRDYLPGNRPVD